MDEGGAGARGEGSRPPGSRPPGGGPRLRVKVPEPPPHLAALLKDRKFRWPDGSLRPEKPPYPRHVFEERRKWEDLVRYCRTTGGCPECTAGECFRCGTGVSREEHKAYCQALGVWNEPLERLRDEVYAEELAGGASPAAAGKAAAQAATPEGEAPPEASGSQAALGRSPLPQESPLPVAF